MKGIFKEKHSGWKLVPPIIVLLAGAWLFPKSMLVITAAATAVFLLGQLWVTPPEDELPSRAVSCCHFLGDMKGQDDDISM